MQAGEIIHLLQHLWIYSLEVCGCNLRIVVGPQNGAPRILGLNERIALDATLIGAGTVLNAQQVKDVHAAGGRLVVAPNFNPAVVAQALALNMVVLPGVATPTEAFAALDAGAHGLKLFPAEMISPATVKALRAVLPKDAALMPVGGITPDNMAAYRTAGASGFGLGSALYAPGRSAEQVQSAAQNFVNAFRG